MGKKKRNGNISTYTNYKNDIVKAETVVYAGRKNATDFPFFVEICKATQPELKEFLSNYLCGIGYEEVYEGDGFVYAKGNIPILLTAHMDTVHKERVVDYYEEFKDGKHIISSPQGIGGDDRCGIYMILNLVKTHKCSVLFCEDEEVGGVGSTKFTKTNLFNDLKEMKYMIELDRANGNDAVFYDCDNEEFTDFIVENTELKESYGSFSDISTLAPEAGVAAVNISCGYYKAHTTEEYVVMEEMIMNQERIRKLLDVECGQFEYIEAQYYGRAWGGYGNYYGGYWYDDSYYGAAPTISNKSMSSSKFEDRYGLEIHFLEYRSCDNEEVGYVESSEYYEGVTVNDCYGQFFNDYPHVRMVDVIDYEIYTL